ncbi:hypothetical protein ACJJTC_006724 [Scirpophaga incertulas]
MEEDGRSRCRYQLITQICPQPLCPALVMYYGARGPLTSRSGCHSFVPALILDPDNGDLAPHSTYEPDKKLESLLELLVRFLPTLLRVAFTSRKSSTEPRRFQNIAAWWANGIDHNIDGGLGVINGRPRRHRRDDAAAIFKSRCHIRAAHSSFL